ncbi:MAG TPA: efflux RND transporter periplasmic adaptor subunit [Polyangia bacterium]|nr:efflux RND transporter periplasmic adaptor subunit [Polyangia bacterium]
MKRLRNLARAAAPWSAALLLAACRQPVHASAPPPPAPAVTVAAVEERSITEWDEFIGRLEAVESVEIRPRVSGYIERVVFVAGKEVRKGEVLFEIDRRPYQAEVARAEADLVQARSAAALAARSLERSKQLAAGDAISREELDNRTAASERAAAAVHAAQAAVATARLNLEWTKVRSPIRGRVGRAEVTAGNLVQAGAATRLTTVVSLDPIYASFDADERSFLKYAARGGSGPRDHRTPILMGTASEGDRFPHEGYVDFFDNQLDPRSGTVRARAVFTNKDHVFAPGLFARLKLVGGAAYQATLVSDRAVGTDQDKKFVLVVKDDSTVEYRPIQLGRLVDGYRVVAGGIKPGEKVVVNGLQRVRPGMRVTATPGPMLADARPSGSASGSAAGATATANP